MDYQSCGPYSRRGKLILWMMITQRGKNGNARYFRFSLTGPVNWAGRVAQVEVTVHTMQEGCWDIADAVMEKRTKDGGQDTPRNDKSKPRPPPQHTTLKSGCGAWKKPLMGKWEMVMQVIADLSKEAPIPCLLFQVVDGIGDKKTTSFLETLLLAHCLLGWDFWLGKWLKFPAVNHDESVQRKQLISVGRKGS